MNIPMSVEIRNPRIYCKLIGIHGPAGSGKDTIAYYIQETYSDCWITSFADPIKIACAAAFGIPEESFYDQSLKEIKDTLWNVSPRQITQFFGTELFREQIWKLIPGDTEDFWVRRMEKQLEFPGYTEMETVIIPDVRFQNEYDFIIANGGYIIHLTRPGTDDNIGLPNHKSNKNINLTNEERTFNICNNSSFEKLYEHVDAFMDAYIVS